MSQSAASRFDRLIRWWPCFLGGLLLPAASLHLRQWFDPPIAAAVAFFIIWLLVGAMFVRQPPLPTWSLTRWFLGAVLGAVVGGVVTYLMPWG
jgi:hypothetical protein